MGGFLGQHLYESYSHISGPNYSETSHCQFFFVQLRFKIAIKRWYDHDLSEDFWWLIGVFWLWEHTGYSRSALTQMRSRGKSWAESSSYRRARSNSGSKTSAHRWRFAETSSSCVFSTILLLMHRLFLMDLHYASWVKDMTGSHYPKCTIAPINMIVID